MLQNNPTPNGALEGYLKSLVESEGEKVAGVCRLIHTTSGLLSTSPVCKDKELVLRMARQIVSSHGDKELEPQRPEPFDEEMYSGIAQNQGKRVAEISRQIYDVCALSSNVDWCLLIDNARWIMSPYQAEESLAQANIVIRSRGVRLKED